VSRSSRLLALSGVALAAAVSSLSVASAHARSPGAIGAPVRIVAALYERCVSIENPTGTDPMVVIHRRGGVRVGRVTVAIGDTMRPCTGTLRPKDTLEIRQSGAQLRRFTVPALRLRLDPATDRVRGWVPPARGSAVVSLEHRIAGLEAHSEGGPVTPDAEGDFAWAPSSGGNLWHGDVARLTWTSPTFDRVTLYASTPSVTVRIGSPDVTVTGRRADEVRVQVRRDGTVRAGYARRLPPYEVLTYGTLKRSGEPRAPRAGDTVVHSGITGAALTVLPNAMTVLTAGFGELVTTCFPNGQAVVDVKDEYRSSHGVPPTGRLNVIGLVPSAGELEPGDVILVGCQNRKGGAQLKRFVVPAPGG
jgi:hypothetical protein